eukprot:GHVU01062733.1.p2 GENE.GHVU01062733.1~~GHVU01062733.1.p2  ORF type:complete len:171 (+),score=58.04 GHVU01062733.1:30-515(+)
MAEDTEEKRGNTTMEGDFEEEEATTTEGEATKEGDLSMTEKEGGNHETGATPQAEEIGGKETIEDPEAGVEAMETDAAAAVEEVTGKEERKKGMTVVGMGMKHPEETPRQGEKKKTKEKELYGNGGLRTAAKTRELSESRRKRRPTAPGSIFQDWKKKTEK